MRAQLNVLWCRTISKDYAQGTNRKSPTGDVAHVELFGRPHVEQPRRRRLATAIRDFGNLLCSICPTPAHRLPVRADAVGQLRR